MADRISEIRAEYHKGYNSKDRLRGWIGYLLAELDKRDQRIADLRKEVQNEMKGNYAPWYNAESQNAAYYRAKRALEADDEAAKS